MKKLLLFLIIFKIALYSAFAQTITPSKDNEYCPLFQYSFSCTLPKTVKSILGSNCNVSPTSSLPNTTFTCNITFGDVNAKQVLRVTYDDNTSFDFDFKKVKSLFYGASGTAVPSLSSITSARCQITTHNISFSNLQWKTEFENLTFGTISEYEYQLPAGWSLGSTVSNGSNWIAGNNNVSITSDFSTGDGGAVRIRPANKACGSNLTYGAASVAVIPVSRPAPTLTVSGPQDYICTANGSASFTLNGIPSGATVQWALSNTTDAQITGSSTSSSVTVTRTSSANVVDLLTATVSHCTFTYTAQQSITLGLGTNSIYFTQKDITCVIGKPYFYGAVAGFPSATNYAWYAKDESIPSNPFILKQSSNQNTADFPLGNNRGNRYYTIRVIATNPCGDVQSIDADGYTYAPDCIGTFVFVASPNPATNSLSIEMEPTEAPSKKTFYRMQLANRNGKIMKQKNYQKGIEKDTIDISDLKPDFYIIRIFDGKVWSAKTIIKN